MLFLPELCCEINRPRAGKSGHKPRFLILFERLFVTAVAFFIAGILVLLIQSWR